MIADGIELKGGVSIQNDVQRRVQYCGAKGLDFAKAKELGFFERMSHLLSLIYTMNMSAYMVGGEIDYMLDSIGAKKHEIKKMLSRYDKAVEQFVFFFTNYFNGDEAKKDMMMDCDNLYKNVMQWANLPIGWKLGERQHSINNVEDLAIKVDMGDDEYMFYKTVMDVENIEEPVESWCVTKYDYNSKSQTTINTKMDKASAVMVAKRLSVEDKENFYTASLMRDIVESRCEVTPFKVFQSGETIGSVTKKIKTDKWF